MVDKNCPMDLPKTSIPNLKVSNLEISNIKTDSLQIRVDDILNKLQQAGLFRAIVIESNGNKLLLDTASGQLRGITADKLIKGDEILARVLPGKTEPRIQVEQVLKASQPLPDKIVNQLIKILTSTSEPTSPKTIASPTTASNSSAKPSLPPVALPQAVKVLAHTTDKTFLQLDHKTYTIPRQNLLQPGETLLLKTNPSNNIELIRVQPENILKNALSNLLPRLATAQNNPELSHLQKLVSSFLKLNPAEANISKATIINDKLNLQSVINRAEHSSTTKQSVNNQAINSSAPNVKKEATIPETPIKVQKDISLQAAVKKSQKEVSLPASSINIQKETPINLIKQLLQTLSQPLIRADNVKAESLQQILGMLTLLKPSVPVKTSQGIFSIPDNLAELHKAINKSPENFKLLLRQIIDSNTPEAKVRIPDNILTEISGTLKIELSQQLEQTLSQLLTQKTTIRLNQEQNQPIQINLNIPLQVNEENRSLKLSIKQRNSSDKDEQNNWEISLAFEFALLGLISTNILLQDTKLSAHFWAVKSGTKQLIDTHMDQFKNQLKKSGFEPGLFDCFIGKPTTQEEKPHPVGENLVDIKV
ncbi:MAG: flagellar hook-length control protein FliK [Gammaproteobacteria bacterium]|jgi:hypothetical protein|nr:flagellar hook-length control protein FliK [Gammaproteobacteria bacterium]MBT3722642.1 flagellar hook-length control protein FliK [Gammaproteobacteria bacterium]MBT4193038.1 flagellar hook-length control protein FliK [Gammaproteobacteria bacterium]MBT4451057.1 flagellar hook-length control protein FliK [Gammaproteobacteria bacterium]MBT4860310.1 flagellar hook-length control protein FliK [Gammaproteobacteria bacterium]